MSDEPENSQDQLNEEISAILRQISRETPLKNHGDVDDWLTGLDSPFRILFDQINQPAMVFALPKGKLDGPCLEANLAAFRQLGYSRDELTGLTLQDILASGSEPPLGPAPNGQASVNRVQVSTQSGQVMPAKAILTKIQTADMQDYLLCVLESQPLMAEADRHGDLGAQAFDYLHQAAAIADAHGVLLKINPAFTELTGQRFQDAVGRSLKVRSPENKSPDFFKTVCKTASETGSWQGAVLYHHLGEGDRVFVLRVTAIKNGGQEASLFLATLAVMEGEGINKERLVHLAQHDSLTGLPNRMLFHDRLKQALAQAKRSQKTLALLFLDIDNFKTINDSLSHAIGDQFLQGVASRLLVCMRDGDTVSRLGGDEFVIILPDVEDVDGAILVAKRIMTALSKPVICDEHELVRNASIGITLFPSDGKDPETLIKNADMAMFRAKEQGKHTYQLYNPAMQTRVSQRLNMEHNLRKAYRSQEFVVHYQPKVNLLTGQVVGMEALVRWMRPGVGIVSPAKFIPLAEETGLIVPIGEWVLREACRATRHLHDLGREEFKVSVNLSGRQFLWQPDLEDMLQNVLDDSGLLPHALELEITESVVMHNVEGAISTMNKLHTMGVSLSLDDFGTGYSSMQYLKQFPLDVLKVDQSFVRGIPGQPEDIAIVKSIISMAHTLKLKVVAEGVEHQSQADFLAANGCDQSQGYLYSKPLPFDDLLAFLDQRDAKGL